MSNQPGAIPLGLEQQKAARPVDPEQLEAMGKRAAARFAECGGTLNDAVVSIVKEAMLSPEQVKRVCEFANTSAYLTEFEKAGEVRNVTFDGGPASPSVVLKELNDGSAPAIHQVKEASYEPPTTHYKVAGASDSVLAEAFGVSGMEKAASVDHLSRAEAAEEVADMRVRLDAVRDDLMSKLSHSEVFLDDVKDDLYSAVKQEVMDGASLGDIMSAWSGYGDANQVKEAMSFYVLDRLRDDGVMDQEQIENSICKTAEAGRVPNPNHPAIERFLVLTKAAAEHRKLQTAVEIVDEQRAEVNARLGISHG